MLPKTAAPMPLDALLAFVDECDLTDDAQLEEQEPQLQPQWWPTPAEDPTRTRRPSCESTASSSSSSVGSVPTPKTRPRRDVVELAALQRKVATLTVQLARVQETRSFAAENETTLLQSNWRVEADRQSKQRAAAQRENEQLRAQLEAQKQVAKRLVNVLKRSSSNQIIQSLQRYEEAASIRAQDKDDDFDAAYHQTNAVLDAADFASLPPVFFDAQMQPLPGHRGLSIEFRRRQSLPWSLSTAAETYWRFSPYRNLRKRFIVEQTDSVLDDLISCTFRFQPKHDPSSKWFRGQYLQRRYKTSDRVVIVWKSLLESTERAANSATDRLRMTGSGWIVIQIAASTDSTGPPWTCAQLLSRFTTELQSGIEAIQDAQHDARVSVMTDFVLLVSEGYADIAAQMVHA